MKILKYPCELCENTSVALGRFDGVHLAHKAVIEAAAECSAEGLVPAVFTFCDNPGKAATGVLTTEEEKQQLIKNCGIDIMVNAAFDTVRDLSPEEFVQEVLAKKLRAKKVFCGYNYRFGKNAHADARILAQLCAQAGIAVTCVPEILAKGKVVSSTAVRNLLSEGKVTEAEKLLGRPYTLAGRVVHGKALGRTIDTPTLNIAVDGEKLLPRFGVYAACVVMNGEIFKSVANIGVKPTVGSQTPTVEAYLLDQNGDFYGKDVTLRLVEFIRSEQKFSDLQELKNAIANDIICASTALSAKDI